MEASEPRGPRALVIQPDGTATLTELPFAPAAQLRVLHELLGGYLEAIRPSIACDWCCYVNEEGKLMGLPLNMQADVLCRVLGFRFMPGDHIVGPAVFLGTLGPDETDVPDYIVDLARSAGMAVA